MIPNEYIIDFVGGKASGTKRLYQHGVSLFDINILKDTPPSDITEKHFTMFCKWLEQQELKPASRHSYAKGVRRFLRYLSRNGLSNIRTDFLLEIEDEQMQAVPERKYKLPKGTKDFASLYHEQPAPPRKAHKVYLEFLRDRAFIGVLEATGTRINAACQIKVIDIDWKSDPVQIRITGKGNREHDLRIDSRQARYLKQWLSERGKADDYVFPAMRGDNYMSDETGRNILRRWVTRVLGSGYNFTPHALRHLFVTKMRDKHGLEMAQALVDHKSISTTAKYPDSLKESQLDKAYKEAIRA